MSFFKKYFFEKMAFLLNLLLFFAKKDYSIGFKEKRRENHRKYLS
jgi:hypothetical protein